MYGLVIFISMCAWGVLHSWLVAFSTKDLAQRIAGEDIQRYYRLIYNLVAVLTLSPILAMVIFLPSRVLWRIPAPWVYLTLTLQALALFGVVITFRQIDTRAFIGLRQQDEPAAEDQNQLVTQGLYGWVRHPLYFFFLIVFWLFPVMTDLSLAFVIAASLYIIIGIIPEERKLVAIYGDAYREYQQKVPRIIPWSKIL